MHKMTTAAVAALMAAGAVLPATTSPADAGHRHRTRNIVGGVVLGAAALAIIANSNRARASGYGGYSSRRSDFYRTCNKWYYQCTDGNNYACEKYETRGCTE